MKTVKACILCIGPYDKSLSKFMDNDPIYYSHLEDGESALVHLFNTEYTPDTELLGEAIGVKDYTDMSQCNLVNSRIDFDALEAIAGENSEDLLALHALMDKKFKFYFEVSFE